VVHLDEATTLDTKGTARFRVLVSERHHALTIKYAPSLTLRGAARVVVTANNPDALGIRSVASIADLDAIAERILYLHIGPEAGEYLRSLGPEALREWVTAPDGTPGAIARHLAAEAPDTTPDGRWLVAGVRTVFHDSLVATIPEYAAALHAISVARADRAPRPRPVVTFPRGGAVGVDAVALRAGWPVWGDGSRAPTPVALAETLRALSIAEPSDGRFYVSARIVEVYARRINGTAPNSGASDPTPGE
jgi:hypothetical protein